MTELEKKDWVLVPLFLPGNLSVTNDEKGQKHQESRA